MGQYHTVVNLDKKEFVNPHKLACGLKLIEQLHSVPGTGSALIVLLASASNGSGGGDLRSSDNILGRWCGNRIAFVGDYDEDSEYAVIDKNLLEERQTGQQIFRACMDDEDHSWKDVSLEVCKVLEFELNGQFSGSGWRTFTHNE